MFSHRIIVKYCYVKGTCVLTGEREQLCDNWFTDQKDADRPLFLPIESFSFSFKRARIGVLES